MKIRFRLRGILILTFVVAVVLIAIRKEYEFSEAERAAGRMITATGGLVSDDVFHFSLIDRFVRVPKDRRSVIVHFLDWVSRGKLGYRVQFVNFGTTTTEKDIDTLQQFKLAQSVHFSNVNLSPGMIAKIGRSPNIEGIGLDNCNVDGLAEGEFAQLRSVHSLSIAVRKATKNDVPIWLAKGMDQLKLLVINGDAYGQLNLDELVTILNPEQLKGLDVRNVILQGDINNLSRFRSMRGVAMAGTGLTTSQLAVFRTLPELEYINYTFNVLTPADRDFFKSLSGVRVEILHKDLTSESFGP